MTAERENKAFIAVACDFEGKVMQVCLSRDVQLQ